MNEIIPNLQSLLPLGRAYAGGRVRTRAFISSPCDSWWYIDMTAKEESWSRVTTSIYVLRPMFGRKSNIMFHKYHVYWNYYSDQKIIIVTVITNLVWWIQPIHKVSTLRHTLWIAVAERSYPLVGALRELIQRLYCGISYCSSFLAPETGRFCERSGETPLDNWLESFLPFCSYLHMLFIPVIYCVVTLLHLEAYRPLYHVDTFYFDIAGLFYKHWLEILCTIDAQE